MAAVIVSIQVLGRVAFEFRLSIARILVALFSSAILEVGLGHRRRRVDPCAMTSATRTEADDVLPVQAPGSGPRQ
jgi:hypothetical protein